MEQLDVFDCLNVLIASYFTDDRGCATKQGAYAYLSMLRRIGNRGTGKENRSASGRLRFHAA